jgi:hypothetical protein
MDDDKIINFPGAKRREPASSRSKPAGGPPPAAATASGAAQAPVPPGALSADQVKAIQLAHSGMSFIVIAIKPTPGGADFFTAVHGDATELRNAQDHLGGVIDRAFARKGI